MLKLTDRVKQTSLTEGTGSIIFNGTFGSFQPFSVIGDGNSTYYTIENGINFEVGIGTYTASTNSLSRDLILDSSNSGNKINLVGLSIVFCTYPASHSVFLNQDGYVSGQMPFYSGIAFPDGSIQISSLSGSGVVNKLTYWSDPKIVSPINNITWADSILDIDGSVVIHDNLNVRGTASVSGSIVSSSTIDNSIFVNDLFYRTSAGCFFHAYVDNAYDEMIALYSTNEANPTWILGIKPYSTSFVGAPDSGYVSGENGSAGIYATDQNGAIINYTNGFWVRHRNLDIFNADKNNGITIYNATASKDALRVIGAAAQSANLQTWENFTSTIIASINSTGQFYTQSIKFPDNSIQTKAYIETWRSVNSNTNILSSDDIVLVDCSLSNVNITLPSAINLGGKKIIIKRKTGNFNLTISAQDGENIDGLSTYNITKNYQSIKLISDNTNWFIT